MRIGSERLGFLGRSEVAPVAPLVREKYVARGALAQVPSRDDPPLKSGREVLQLDRLVVALVLAGDRLFEAAHVNTEKLDG